MSLICRYRNASNKYDGDWWHGFRFRGLHFSVLIVH